jgi:hypothetical protein
MHTCGVCAASAIVVCAGAYVIGPEGSTECLVGSTRITDAGACQTADTAVELFLIMVDDEGDEARWHFLVDSGCTLRHNARHISSSCPPTGRFSTVGRARCRSGMARSMNLLLVGCFAFTVRPRTTHAIPHAALGARAARCTPPPTVAGSVGSVARRPIWRTSR